MLKTLDHKTPAVCAIIDLGDAVAKTKGTDVVGLPDTVTGQRFRMTGLAAD